MPQQGVREPGVTDSVLRPLEAHTGGGNAGTQPLTENSAYAEVVLVHGSVPPPVSVGLMNAAGLG